MKGLLAGGLIGYVIGVFSQNTPFGEVLAAVFLLTMFGLAFIIGYAMACAHYPIENPS